MKVANANRNTRMSANANCEEFSRPSGKSLNDFNKLMTQNIFLFYQKYLARQPYGRRPKDINQMLDFYNENNFCFFATLHLTNLQRFHPL
jgi:hypothetical protein